MLFNLDKMIRILILFVLAASQVFGQEFVDSVSYSKEIVTDFEKVNLADEFERAFDQDKDVKLRFKAGFYDYGPRFPSSTKGLEASLEVKLIDHFSFRAILNEKPTTSYDGYRYPKWGFELRKYLKGKGKMENLSGTFIGIGYLRNNQELLSYKHNATIHRDFNNRPNFHISPYAPGKNEFKLSLGQQLGNILAYSFDFGLKQVSSTILGQDKIFFSVDSKNHYIPFLTSNTLVTIGADWSVKRNNSDKCEFLNCYEKITHLWKVDVSDVLYIDPFFRNLSANSAYERKVGDWPVSVNTAANINYIGFKFFKRGGKSVPFTINDSFYYELPEYEEELIWNNNLVISGYLTIRYYFLQNRDIVKGRSVDGLYGIYLGPYAKFETIGKIGDSFSPFSISPLNYGGTVGYQRKISDNFFFDAGVDMGYSLNSPYYFFNFLSVTPKFEFGYAF